MVRLIVLQIICLLSVNYSIAQQHLKLLSYNIRNAKGMDNKTDYDRTFTIIKNADADVVALQELDSVTKRSGGEDVLKIFAGKTKLFSVYGAAINYQGGKYGVGILSKKKPLYSYSISLPGKEEERVLLIAVFKKYIIFNTHLSLTDTDRIASISIINNEAEKFLKPVYLLGDLNAEPNSNAILALKEKWTLLSGEAPTFPAPVPKKCIDFIFVRNKKIKVITRKVIEEPIASDHRPVLVEVKK